MGSLAAIVVASGTDTRADADPIDGRDHPLPASEAAPGSAGRSAPLVREVSPGHFVHVGVHEDMSLGNRGDVANGGFVIGASGVAAIDPGGGAAVARELAAALRRRSALPLTHVILTHFHPDHVLGARAFVAAAGGGDPEVVAHVRHARAAVQRGAFYLDRYAALVPAAEAPSGSAAEPPVEPPTEPAAQAAAQAAAESGPRPAREDVFLVPTRGVEPGAPLSVALGGRTLEVRAHRVGHTDNDVTVFDAAAGGTLWAGDLLVAERTPSLDGDLRGWLAVLDELAALEPRVVIFGHGQPGGLAEPLRAQRRYLRDLLASVRARIAAGGRLGEALEEAERAPPGHWRLFDLHHPTNVTRAWTELEWE